MLFSLKKFVMKTLAGMFDVYPEFQVREFALNWYARGTLTDSDMQDIDEWYSVTEPPDEYTDEIE